MKRPFYIIINIIYQIIMCWVLVILNAFYNDLIIPTNIAHSSRGILLKLLIAATEGFILISLAYVCNRESLSDINDKTSQKTIAKRTGIMHIIFTIAFITIVILG